MIKWWKIRDFFRSIRPGIKSLITWFPVIWKDRWWDHSFLYSILRKKLELMEEGFRLHGMGLHSEMDAKNMKKCILLLDRLINDAYIDYSKGNNIRNSFEKEEMMIEQDLDLLFNIIRKHIRTWWD